MQAYCYNQYHIVLPPIKNIAHRAIVNNAKNESFERNTKYMQIFLFIFEKVFTCFRLSIAYTHAKQSVHDYIEVMLFNFASEFDFSLIDEQTYGHAKDVMLQYTFNY